MRVVELLISDRKSASENSGDVILNNLNFKYRPKNQKKIKLFTNFIQTHGEGNKYNFFSKLSHFMLALVAITD